VKGAYWDFETVHAEQQGWPIPVYTNKQESDANYERCAFLLLDNYKDISLAIGSHNVRSISACLVYATKKNIPQNAFEIQMLYGMADPIKKSLVGMGYRVREYAPVGELIPGMAYLVRRLLENTSNESFLRSKFAENASTDHLLKDPAQGLTPTSPNTLHPDKFNNHPCLDFGIASVRQAFVQTLEKTKKSLGKTYPIVIGKKEIKTDRTLESRCPFDPSLVVGKVYVASAIEAENAVQLAKETFITWKKTKASDRADYFDKLADYFVQNRMELAATQVYEVGKQWKEADGDICEAIDFCRYYARQMRQLAKAQRVGHASGETSFYHYQPRGVALVIAPWNFPLAILVGMVAAAAVAGNTVIMKPAEQSSIVAAQLMEAIRAIGLPPGVVSFLPGYGEEIGEFLVNHKDVSMIAFTGSKDVGLHILKNASLVHPGQNFVKKCIIEMGGKNAVIVDSDADMDEAVQGVLYSAFGFQGQKCSACSRVIVLEENYDRFVERLVEAAKSMTVGSAEDPSTSLGAVIDG
jgi:RHH-type proline utilization regulon transcriptional repressor/proline dehydrogenase/delta 1-pyrroline-5-carboxylate dehydrogenase